EPGGFETPARHLAYEIARRIEAANQHPHHLLKEARGVARIGVDELVDADTIEGEELGLHVGLDGCRPLRFVPEHAHLSEDSARLQSAHNLLDPPTHLLRDENGARADEEHLFAGITFAEEDLALAQPAFAQAGPEGDELLFFQITQEIDLAEEGDVGRLGHVVSPLHGPALHHDGLDGPQAFGGGDLSSSSPRLET